MCRSPLLFAHTSRPPPPPAAQPGKTIVVPMESAFFKLAATNTSTAFTPSNLNAAIPSDTYKGCLGDFIKYMILAGACLRLGAASARGARAGAPPRECARHALTRNPRGPPDCSCSTQLITDGQQISTSLPESAPLTARVRPRPTTPTQTRGACASPAPALPGPS